METLLRFAAHNPAIRALILTGSRANPADETDDLSDHDIAIIGHDLSFIETDDWLSAIQPHWVCVRDQYTLSGNIIPTRLVIFNDRLQIDFSFIPVTVMAGIGAGDHLPDAFSSGYKVLLDHDNMLMDLPPPNDSARKVSLPDEATFNRNMNEFYFEVWHAAKYLRRGDLWTAKFRDASAKQFLLGMLQWQHALRTPGRFCPKPHGKEMRKWLNPAINAKLAGCFSGFHRENSFEVLRNTMTLYHDVATDTARMLGFSCDKKLHEHILRSVEKAQGS